MTSPHFQFFSPSSKSKSKTPNSSPLEPSSLSPLRSRTRQQSSPQPNPNLRLLWVSIILGLSGLGLLGRLVYLQVFKAKDLQQIAVSQQQRHMQRLVARYAIEDRHGELLAIDQPAATLYVHPILFNANQLKPKNQPAPTDVRAAMAAKLAPILNRPQAELERSFQQYPTGIPIARDLDSATVAKIQALRLNGLELEPTWQRIYPQQGLMSGVVGYVDREYKGQAGLEYEQSKLLQSRHHPLALSRDANGHYLPDLAPPNPQDPALEPRMRLTLDVRLQRAVRTALQAQINKFNAARGTTIVMDVRTGAILALVSEPSFNPTTYYQADPALFRNWAIADLYEPGSTFKPINVAIALETKAIQPTDNFYDEGQIFVDGWPIQNSDFSTQGGRGGLTIPQVLGFSSNVGMVHIMERVRANTYYDFLQRLGLGAGTGTDLPFETPGQLKPRQEFIGSRIEPATTAFGQGFSTTPLQMVQLTAAVVNGGKLVTPHVIAGTYGHDQRVISAPNRPQPRQVFSAATSQAMVNMLAYVVTDGTGKSAQIPGYRLGGKTGTAQKASGRSYGYNRITSFSAVFPLEDPRYVIMTVVDEPKGDNAYGSTVSLPVTRAAIEALITVEGIPPSHPDELVRAAHPNSTQNRP
jgi:cell division protein FtsI (penicillin-binding protein 3)